MECNHTFISIVRHEHRKLNTRDGTFTSKISTMLGTLLEMPPTKLSGAFFHISQHLYFSGISVQFIGRFQINRNSCQKGMIDHLTEGFCSQ